MGGSADVASPPARYLRIEVAMESYPLRQVTPSLDLVPYMHWRCPLLIGG